MLNEFMVANKDTIVLDSANNVLVGPNGYFKVVIDSFDGKTIQAWHFEDPAGNKTANLADSAQGKHIDFLVTKGNRTVGHFVSRYIERFYQANDKAQVELVKMRELLRSIQELLMDEVAEGSTMK